MPTSQPKDEGFRHHLWDDAGQLTGVIGNEYCGYYGYDGDGERVFKLTGTTSGSQYNASSMYLDLYFDDVVMYVSPYMVVTPKGYTKHYYNGSQRIAARLGDYWNNDTGIYYGYSLLDTACVAMEKQLCIDEPIEEVFDDELLQSIDGEEMQSEPFVLGIYNMMYYMPTDMLSDVFYGQKRLADDMWGVENGVYFYHPDHLGSSSWITDDQGHTAQYIHYMPYGEIWRVKQESAYNERFRFTGKERDTETGYDYFGARYYLSLLGIWISPDKKSDEYPHISSYAYCSWNPLKRIDFDGREWKDIEGNIIKDHTDIKAYIYYDPKSFEGQSLRMYKDAVSLYGEGSVALSDVTTQGEFVTDWKNMASPDIQEINVNYHGNNQTIMLNSSEGQYITATGNGLSNVSNTPAFNVQDLPNPIGNVMNAQLNLNTCRSNNHSQHPLVGSGLTLAEAFRSKFNFNIVRGTHAGVSYNRFTKRPEPQHFWQKWDYLYRPYSSQSQRVGLPPR